MKLSKRIEARTKTVRFKWVHRNFLPMGDAFRKVRAKSRNPMDKCKWCGHVFADGEMVALAQPMTGTNMVLCQSCAAEALHS